MNKFSTAISPHGHLTATTAPRNECSWTRLPYTTLKLRYAFLPRDAAMLARSWES